jgi:hypothetical protein
VPEEIVNVYIRHRNLVCVVLVGSVSGCVWLGGNRVPIEHVERVALARTGPIEQIGTDIRRAARMEGWQVEEVAPRMLYVTRSRADHAATAAVTYDRAAFSIELRSSRNLKQGDGKIHKLYNEWVRSLEEAIQREVMAFR